MSTKGNRTAVLLSCIAIAISTLGNAITWTVAAVERGRIQEHARKTEDGLVCLLQRAREAALANPTGRDPGQVDDIVQYYNREIELQGGFRDCDAPRAPRP